jgi:hypothetical protein
VFAAPGFFVLCVQKNTHSPPVYARSALSAYRRLSLCIRVLETAADLPNGQPARSALPFRSRVARIIRLLKACATRAVRR